MKALDMIDDARAPGFNNLQRPVPPLDEIPAALRSRIRLPQVPRALADRHRQAAAAALVARKANGGASSFAHRLLQRVSMGPTLADLEAIGEVGERAWLEQQLHPEEIDDSGLEAALAEALPTLEMTPWEIVSEYHEMPEVPVYELWLATIFRSLYSPRQLLERLVIFWTDHFNVPLLSDLGVFLKPADDRDVIRRHALGTFPELLSASAHSAAMLSFLTNDSNIAEHPNENYARELMELHTLGVGGGYSEADVKEVARALTGWRFFGFRAGPAFGQFFFDPEQHDLASKTILGKTLPAGGGVSDGEAVIELLANHPSTASFISRKLLRYFWGYEPSDAAVARVTGVYSDTGGDIRSMLRSILSWGQLATATPKLKRPYHMIISAARALFAQVENPFFLLRAMDLAGHLPFTWAPPNGFPDSEGYWSGFVLPRWNFASVMLVPESGITLDLPFLDPSLDPEEIRFILDALLLSGTMSAETSDAVRDYLAAAPQSQKSLAEAVGLVVGSPEFQRY